MYGISSLVLVTLACLLRPNIAELCWSHEIGRNCLMNHPSSIDCREMSLQEQYAVLLYNRNKHNGRSTVLKCVPCRVDPTELDDVTCSFNATSLNDDDEQIYALHGHIYVYFSINPQQNNVTISFEHQFDGHAILTEVSGITNVEGIPVGPFVALATSPSIHLMRLRCVDQHGQECGITIQPRRPFALVYYVAL